MNTQAVVLAGGNSSRFYPFNRKHKTTFEVAGKPIIVRTVESLLKAQVNEIIIVISPESNIPDVITQYCPTEQITYAVQQEALGQANAILAAKPYIHSPFFVINAQNWQVSNHIEPMTQVLSENSDIRAVLIHTTTHQVEKYGILGLDGQHVTSVTEKPSKSEAASDQRIVGTYLFTQTFLQDLEETNPQEYQLEETLDRIAKSGQVMALPVPSGDPTLKYPWDLFEIKDEILDELTEYRAEDSYIAPTATIRGPVYIGSKVQIHDHAIIEGPAYIGDNALVGAFSIVRNRSVLEAGAQIERYCDVRNSIIGRDTHIHSEFIGDSIIGQNGRIGAGFITGNKRLDRQNVKVTVKDELIDCGQNNLGVLIGDSVGIGIRVSTMPGTVLGTQVKVGPGLTIKGLFTDEQVVKESNC